MLRNSYLPTHIKLFVIQAFFDFSNIFIYIGAYDLISHSEVEKAHLKKKNKPFCTTPLLLGEELAVNKGLS